MDGIKVNMLLPTKSNPPIFIYGKSFLNDEKINQKTYQQDTNNKILSNITHSYNF